MTSFQQEQQERNRAIDSWKGEQPTFNDEVVNLKTMINKSRFGTNIAGINLFSKNKK